MAEKVTIMVLKVDLQCPHCRKKIKKILSKFPHQRYDEKQNTVTIMVLCCSPEKIRDKLCCKGGKTIKSIDILPPPKPKAQEKPAVKPKEAPKPDPPKKLEPAPKALPPPEPAKLPEPVRAYPIGISCAPCYEDQVGGPCYHGYGEPPPPPPGLLYDSYEGYGRGYGWSRGDCFSEENPSACTIM